MLCGVCEDFLRAPPNVWLDAWAPLPHLSFEDNKHGPNPTSTSSTPREGIFLYHTTLRSLQVNAAHQRCHLCTLIWARLQRNFSADALGPDKVIKALEQGSYASEESPQVRICVRQIKSSASYVYLCVDVAMKGDLHGLRDFLPILTKFTALLEDIGNPLCSSTSDDACFDIAIKWLNMCKRQHEDCYYHGDFSTIVPARLLDVGEPCNTGLIKLHATSCSQSYEYLTLSHCWGKSSRLRLIKELLGQFLNGIEIKGLARTFREAVKITQRLGFRYLWIDCLCIIQDSSEDWATESAKMAGIYGNGVCNIAAAASSDSDGGCFVQRKPREIQPLKLSYSGSNDVHKSFQEPVCVFGDNVESTWDEVAGSLEERGWILQEIALAPRTLYYGKNQLYWECRSVRACEVWPTGDQTHGHMWSDKNLTEKLVFDTEHLRDEEEDGGWSEGDVDLLYSRWEYLVERFSTKLLTYGSDKLIALSGLADMFASRTGDRYLAGLWEGNLLHGLVWSIAPNKDTSRPGTSQCSFRAPSWSWASIDGAIQYPIRKSEGLVACAQVLNVDIQNLPVGESQTGHILGASLRIQGPVKTATWVPAPPHGQYGMQLVCNGYQHNRDLLMRLYPDTERDALETTVHCLQLCRQPRGSSQRVFGLVLIPTGVVEGEYRRIGSFQTPGSHSPDDQVREGEDWSAFEDGWSEREMTII